MERALYGLLIIVALFVVLMVFNPNISCFGRRLKSPFYPLKRKRPRTPRTDDYGFDLGGGKKGTEKGSFRGKRHGLDDRRVAQDYGFDLGGKKKGAEASGKPEIDR